ASAPPFRCRAALSRESPQSPPQRLRIESTPVFTRTAVLIFLISAGCAGSAIDVVSAEPPPRILRWAGDPEGGAPFVEADPARPDRLVGFDVELAGLLAAAIGRTTQFVNIRFESIDQSVARGHADIGMSGI